MAYETTTRKCGRCKGSGQARFNHLNGDTHCYLCGGSGRQTILTPKGRAQKQADEAYYSENFPKCHQYGQDCFRALGEMKIYSSGPTREEHQLKLRALTFWTAPISSPHLHLKEGQYEG